MPESLVKESVTGPARHHHAINLPERIALGAILGIATGIVFGERAAVLQPIGDAYGAMLQIAVFPYLLSSLMHSLGRLSPVDLVVVEGFKRHRHPKLEVFRAAVAQPLLHPDDDCIVAVATDAPLSQALVPVLMLDDFDGIANVFEAEAAPLDQIGPPRGDT